LIPCYLRPHCEVAGHSVDLVHYIERFGPNSKKNDREFVEELAHDKRWVVISGDKENVRGKVNSLRVVCRQKLVTLIYAGSAVRHAGLEFYGPQFTAHWKEIMAAAGCARGGQYVLRMSSRDHSRTILEATECPVGYRCDGALCVPIKPITVYDGEPESLSRRARRAQRKKKGA
jgi:hypothetical protein